MSYSEFVNTLGNGCSLIFNGIVNVSNTLIHNYIFITLLGLVLFCSIIHIVSDFLVIPIKNIDKKQDKKSDKKYKHSEPESTDIVDYPEPELSSIEELN